MKTVACFKCGHSWDYTPPLGRKDDCPKCHWDAHVCLNCIFFDRHAHHECREPEADYVKDKERSNFCDYLQPNPNQGQIGNSMDQHKSKLDQLFSNQGQKIDDESEDQPKSLADELANFLKKR